MGTQLDLDTNAEPAWVASDPELVSDEDLTESDEEKEQSKEDLEAKKSAAQIKLEKRIADRRAATESRVRKYNRKREARLKRAQSVRGIANVGSGTHSHVAAGDAEPAVILAGRELTEAERAVAAEHRKQVRLYHATRGLDGRQEQLIDQLTLVRKRVVPEPPRPPPMPLRGLPRDKEAKIQDDRNWDFDELFGENSRLARQFAGAGGA